MLSLLGPAKGISSENNIASLGPPESKKKYVSPQRKRSSRANVATLSQTQKPCRFRWESLPLTAGRPRSYNCAKGKV